MVNAHSHPPHTHGKTKENNGPTRLKSGLTRKNLDGAPTHHALHDEITGITSRGDHGGFDGKTC